MIPSARVTPALVPLLLLVSACADHPVAPLVEPDPPLPRLSEIRCMAVLARGELSCEGRDLSTEERDGLSQIMVGGQHSYVRLINGPLSVAGSVVSFPVIVQNLLQQPMGTTDGSSSHPAGVRVFFAQLSGSGGTGEVSVVNPTGTDLFTAAGQPYVQYGGNSGGELGGDGMLTPGETSAIKQWQIEFGTHTSFSFVVYVAAEVPDPSAAYLRFTQISAGGSHSCGVTNGGAWCWGSGGDGRLGNGRSVSSSVPVPVTQTASGVFTHVSASGDHSCGIASSGAWCWGWGFYGQLGDDGSADSSVPVPVTQSGSGVFTEVSAGWQHSCGITDSGAWCWGDGEFGRLGNGSGAGSGAPQPVTQSGSGVFTRVSAGFFHSCGITSGGAWCWGLGWAGQLGDGGTGGSDVPAQVTQGTSGVFTQVSVGGDSSCGTTSSGAWCWGWGSNGQLGNGGTASSYVPVAVTQTASGVFTQVTTAWGHSCGLSSSGAWCWGGGSTGRLGTGRTLQETTPAPVAGSRAP
jgi:hypothetical protein